VHVDFLQQSNKIWSKVKLLTLVYLLAIARQNEQNSGSAKQRTAMLEQTVRRMLQRKSMDKMLEEQ
jgi:hypothetical protein